MTLLLTLVEIASAQTSSRRSEDARPSDTESIGDQLLEDLAPGMFDEPAAPRADEPKDGEPAAQDSDLNFRMPGPLNHWGEHGEDIGGQSPAAPLPLLRARDGMQQAKTLLGRNETIPRADEVQQEVVAQLDVLIAELSKKCQGGNSRPGNQPPKPNQAQSKPGKSGSKAGQGITAARDSSSQLNSAATEPVDKATVDELVKDLWGHLPERSREQMLQSFTGEFLPEYELEIEKYYRRLAEEKAEDSAE